MKICIAIADASRARLFQLERTDDPDGVHETLEERTDLVNPARRLRPAQLFSSSPGAARAGDLRFGFDDHRAEHLAKMDADFARDIAKAIAAQIDATRPKRLILCASPAMLGELRGVGDAYRLPDVSVDEMPRDLVKLTSALLRDQLASYGLLPPAP